MNFCPHNQGDTCTTQASLPTGVTCKIFFVQQLMDLLNRAPLSSSSPETFKPEEKSPESI